MSINQIKPAKGSRHHVKRVGRGQGSGFGLTAGRGTKGAQSRSGHKNKRGFEGGQMPIQRRMPKRGFQNINTIEYQIFNLGQIDELVEKYAMKDFSLDCLRANKLIKGTDLVKILGNGEIKSPVVFKVNAVSQKAKEAIEAVGGSVELLK